MKIHILAIPSSPAGNNLRALEDDDPDTLEVHQDNDDGTTTDFTISRADFLAAPELKYPDPIPLVTVTSDWMKEHCNGGHWWLANGTYKALRQLLEKISADKELQK